MDDEPIKLPPVPKKPYVRPQLHELTGSSADGKIFGNATEYSALEGPS